MTNGEGYKASIMDMDNHSRYSLQIVAGEKRLDKNDGHNFLNEAIKNQASYCVISKKLKKKKKIHNC